MNLFVKMTGSFLVIISTASYGLMLSSDLKKRLEELKEIKKMLFLLKGEIRFGRCHIFEALENISSRCKKPISSILLSMSKKGREEHISRFSEIWDKTWNDNIGELHINGEERDRLITFGNTIGLSDSDSQENAINSYAEEIEKSIEELSCCLPKKVKIYNSMGIVCGIIITLIIV